MYSTSNTLDYQKFSGSPLPLTSTKPAQVKTVSFSVEPSSNGGVDEDPEQGKSGSFTLEPWPSGSGEGPVPLEAPARRQIKTRDPWSTGLCDCFDDVRNCCITCWCPCITFGHVAEIIDKGSTSCGTSGAVYTVIACVTGCSCFYSCFYRAKMRQQYMLKESPCADCCVHCFCEYCALCQEYRELQNRGFELPLGWQENLERDEGLAMPMTSTSSKAPQVEAEMSR